MTKAFRTIGLLAGLSTAGIAPAHAGLFGEVGTTGAGARLTVPIHRDFDVRAGMGQLGYSYKGGTKNLDFDFRLKAKTYDVLLDWYPSTGSAFRLTAGFAYNGNTITGSARPNGAGAYTLQGNTYQASEVGSITTKIGFDKAAPYLGIGWGRAVEKEKGWTFSSDIGVLFQGSPKSALTNSGCTAGGTTCNQLANDLARENVILTKEADKLKLYPVLRVGVSYKF